VIEHNKDLDSLIDKLKAKGLTFKDFVLKFVHQSEVPVKPVRFAPVRIYGVRKKEWTPDYLIGLRIDHIELNESMLIDSGADISVISKKVGDILGLQVTKSEMPNEVGKVVACHDPSYQIAIGKVVVSVDEKYFRPTEVELLIGDPTKSMTKLGWQPKYDLKALVDDMMQGDLKIFTVK
jgi:hypothetical protein